MENTTEEDLRIQLSELQKEKIETEHLWNEAYERYTNIAQEIKRILKEERELLELIHRVAGTSAD